MGTEGQLKKGGLRQNGAIEDLILLRPGNGNNMSNIAMSQTNKQALTEEIFETLGIPLEPEYLGGSPTEPGLKSRLQELQGATPAKAMSPAASAYHSSKVLDAVPGMPVKHG